MKTIAILALIFCASLSSLPLRAQDDDDDDDDTEVDYRFTAGVNFAFVEETPQLTDAVTSFGYMLGVAAEVGERFFIQPGLQYASYGSTVTLASAEGDTKHGMRLGYVRVPVQAGLRLFKPGSSSPLNVEARAGISESFLVGFSDKVRSGSGAALSSNDVASARTAAIVGAGIRLLFFSLDVEYEFGLTNTIKNSGATKLDALYVIFGGNF